MSRNEPDDARADAGDSSSDGLRLTRRTLVQATGGSLLGSAAFGNATDVAAAAPHDGTDPTPGNVDWNTYIEDPGVVGEFNEAPHVPTTKPYGSLSAARDAEQNEDFLTDQWLESNYVKSLSGAWKFDFATDLGGATTDTSDYGNWDSVYVPHTWNTDGYGDLEFYNVDVGFEPNDPPNVPSTDNSVGTYKREFTVPSGWTSGRRTYLTVGGAKAGYFVWVNDSYVGFKKGSMTPGEFDVTDVVTEGSTNTVTIQVVRWTDGTYLEQQHMWRLAGIFRDVLLYSKPDVHVRDIGTVTDLDSSYSDGTLDVSAAVANHADSQQSATVRATLYDPAGSQVQSVDRSVTVDAGRVTTMDSTDVADQSAGGNTGTIVGDPSFVSGANGNALDFDGSDDWVEGGTDGSLNLTGEFTIEAVVYGESLSGEQPIVTKGDRGYALKMSGGDLQFFVYSGSNWNTVTVAPPSGWSGSWHTVTGVYDGSALRLYVDGTEIGSTSFSGTVEVNGYALAVGHNTEKSSRYFGGRVDSARIYDRALSASEVASTRTAPDGSSVLWYDFEDTGSPISMSVSDVETWTAETPTLYTLGIELIPSGSPSASEAMIEKVGFRTIELASTSDGSAEKITVNGEGVTLAGTNRHEYSLDHGRHVPTERMRKEIELAKRNNINAFRTAHYPTRPDFYRLCDEYGIYVQDEINTEAHDNQSLVNDHRQFDQSFLDRFKRMVVRDKNFASINVWSTGNEAGRGPAHDEMAAFANGADGTRLLGHQDNAGSYGSGFGGTANFADVNGIRYPYPGTIESMANDGDLTKPVVMGEYQIFSGNGGGLMHDFYENVYSYEQLAGGYIWMWNHHQLNATEAPLDGNLLSEDHRRAAVDDQSVAGHTALVNGSPTEVSGESGSALDFDGSDDWVDANHDDRIDLTGELTVEAVVYGDSPSGYAPIVAKGDTQYTLRFDGGDLEFFVYDGSSWHSATAATPSGWSGSWHTVTGVYDGSAVRLYVDGTELASTPFSGEVDSNRYRVGIGHNTEATDRYADIRVDSVRIFDRALSSGEVDSRSSPDDSCRLWLDMDLREHHWGDPPVATGQIIDDRYTMPGLSVTKKAHQFVRFGANDLANGDVDVTNVYDFTNLDQFDFSWELKEDDTVVQSGSLNPSVAPGNTQTVNVGYSQPSLQAGSEYFLDVSVTLASDESWADAGHEVAFEQFVVPWDVPEDPQASLSNMSSVSYSESGSEVTVSGSDFTYVFDTSAGRFTSFQRHGEELLNAGPRLNAWREPVHNETNSWGGAEADEWTAAGLDAMTATVDSSSVSQPDSSAVRIEVQTTDSASDASEVFTTNYTYNVLGTGDVVTSVEVTPNSDMQSTITEYLPKYGLQLRMPDQFDSFEWFGRGPGETYPDRKWDQRIGRYSGSVADQFVEYIQPGDYGNKCDARYAALTNDGDVGLLVHDLPATETMNVSVQAFTNMSDESRISDLQFADGVVFNVDYAVSGVGGMPRNTLSQYSVDPISQQFTYAFRPFDAGSEDPLELSRRDLPYSDASSGGGSGPLSEGTYWIENVNSGKAMDVADSSTSDGGNVQQYDYWGGENQQWNAVENDDGTYRFENVNSGKALSVDGASTSEGATLVQETWNENDEQRWTVLENSDGTYRLENANSGHVADVNGASTGNGADVIQWSWNGGDNQKWRFNSP